MSKRVDNYPGIWIDGEFKKHPHPLRYHDLATYVDGIKTIKDGRVRTAHVSARHCMGEIHEGGLKGQVRCYCAILHDDTAHVPIHVINVNQESVPRNRPRAQTGNQEGHADLQQMADVQFQEGPEMSKPLRIEPSREARRQRMIEEARKTFGDPSAPDWVDRLDEQTEEIATDTFSNKRHSKLPTAVIIAVKPRWASLILSGQKTIELRRRFRTDYWGVAYIYATAPVMAITGRVIIKEVKPFKTKIGDGMAVNRMTCVSQWEFDDYFKGVDEGRSLHLESPRKFLRPWERDSLLYYQNMVPPQSHKFLNYHDAWDFERVTCFTGAA